MKKLILFALSIVLLTTLFWVACSKPDDEGWTDDEKASYEEVISLQDEVSNNLDEWFLSMDSLDAIDMAHQSFASEPSVSSAIISSQGISVQYANGMRGGLFINPRDGGTTEKSFESLIDGLNSMDSESLKSLVNKRKMILLNPHYYERAYYTDILVNNAWINLERAGITVFRNRNEGSSVDAFTQLADYGIIQIYSHGLAWPKEENITDVYLLTGETANEATSKKYWDELKSGNIPIMNIGGSSNKYYISERFISDYNDFSQDTILFYGGFCYSFLGDWPDITESFADGAYFGFDWSVRTSYNAMWAENLIDLMSDTSMTEPMGPEAWMNNSDKVKSYWEPRYERTVHIYYTGDGNLNLWSDVSVNLIALSEDGTPVSKPGEAGVAYPFRCDVVSNITELEYSWDIGNGGSPVTASNAVNITWSEDGDYVLKVDVKDKSNGNIIGSATANVTIGANPDVTEFMLSTNYANFVFYDGVIWDNDASVIQNWIGGHDFESLAWDGNSFSGTYAYTHTAMSYTYTILGTLSNDGQSVSYTFEQEGWGSNQDETYIFNYYFKLTVDNLPLWHFELPSNKSDAYVDYGVEGGQNGQNYITTFVGSNWDETGTLCTITGINWETVENFNIRFKRFPTTSY